MLAVIICFSSSSPEKQTNRMCVCECIIYIYIERVTLRRWLIQLWGLANLKSTWQTNRPEIQERSDVVLSSKVVWRLQNSLSLGDLWLSFSFLLIGWGHPHYEGNLLDSKFIDLNVNCHLKNIFTTTSKLVFDQTSQHQRQAKWS